MQREKQTKTNDHPYHPILHLFIRTKNLALTDFSFSSCGSLVVALEEQNMTTGILVRTI